MTQLEPQTAADPQVKTVLEKMAAAGVSRPTTVEDVRKASVSGAVFLILELYSPYRGLIRISDAPRRSALRLPISASSSGRALFCRSVGQIGGLWRETVRASAVRVTSAGGLRVEWACALRKFGVISLVGFRGEKATETIIFCVRGLAQKREKVVTLAHRQTPEWKAPFQTE